MHRVNQAFHSLSRDFGAWTILGPLTWTEGCRKGILASGLTLLEGSRNQHLGGMLKKVQCSQHFPVWGWMRCPQYLMDFSLWGLLQSSGHFYPILLRSLERCTWSAPSHLFSQWLLQVGYSGWPKVTQCTLWLARELNSGLLLPNPAFCLLCHSGSTRLVAVVL